MISHQISNSSLENYEGVFYRTHDWESHLHRSFEFIIVFSGSLFLRVGSDEYTLFSSESILIPPFAPHSIEASADASFFIAVFSGNYAEDVAQLFKLKHAQSYKFTLSEKTREYVTAHLCPAGLISDGGDVYLQRPKKFMLKSCLYAITSEFLDGATLKDKKREDMLILEVLSYIEAHFLENMTLCDMAHTLGYSHEYVSRIFNRTLGINFKALVNQYRLEYALRLIRESDDALVSIAMASGFQSLRSFNRACRDILGASPTEIKRKISEDV